MRSRSAAFSGRVSCGSASSRSLASFCASCITFTSAPAVERSAADKSYGNWTRVYFWSESPDFESARYVRVNYTPDPESSNTFCWTSEIRAYGYIRGDFNGDRLLTSADAIYLLRHVLFGDEYPAGQNCDMDGDGTTGSGDAVYLLRHVLFGEDYPLQ